jgi:hypothetical protein
MDRYNYRGGSWFVAGSLLTRTNQLRSRMCLRRAINDGYQEGCFMRDRPIRSSEERMGNQVPKMRFVVPGRESYGYDWLLTLDIERLVPVITSAVGIFDVGMKRVLQPKQTMAGIRMEKATAYSRTILDTILNLQV